MAYDSKAVEFVYSFYARGWSRNRALPEIRKVYAGFAGSTWDDWETRYGWKQRRALADAKLREFEDTARDLNRTLLMELNEARTHLFTAIQAGKADTQIYHAYVNLARRQSELAEDHFAGRDQDKVAMRVLNDAIEAFVTELRKTPEVSSVLERYAEVIGDAASVIAERFGQ